MNFCGSIRLWRRKNNQTRQAYYKNKNAENRCRISGSGFLHFISIWAPKHAAHRSYGQSVRDLICVKKIAHAAGMLHPYPHTHFIFTAVCPRIIWNKAKGNRRFFRSLNRAVKTLRRFFFFIFLKALHEDLFD